MFTVDLSPLIVFLQSLGPWGWVAAAGLILLQMRRGKPVLPTPTPADPTNPAPNVPDAVDGLIDRLRDRLKQRFPNLPPLFAEAVPDPAAVELQPSLADEYERVRAKIEQRREALRKEWASLPASEIER